MLLTKTPSIVDDLIKRLRVKAIADGYTAIVLELEALKPTKWFNLPYKLNTLMNVIKNYQLLALDGDVQDKIDEIGKIHWFNYFIKIAILIELTELIEAI
jgi:serine/threonine protein kinase HipA of HipAB toxin-antitoxin module